MEFHVMWVDGLIGIIGSVLIAGIAYLRKSLSFSGACAAIVMGTTMYVVGSLIWFGPLLVFFITSSILSKLKSKRKEHAESYYAKGHQRDAGQVWANGGLAFLCCIAYVFSPHPLWWWATLGALSAVTADTWATEIGGMSRAQPRSILTGKPVPAGTSGGVSVLGMFASILGGSVIGFSGIGFLMLVSHSDTTGDFLNLMNDFPWWLVIMMGSFSGLMGSLFDSWLGAKYQVMYRCVFCAKEIEKPVHCAQRASLIRGKSWMNNDTVNGLSSLFGSACAICLVICIQIVL